MRDLLLAAALFAAAPALALAADAPPAIEAYGRFPAVDDLVMSASGKLAAFVANTPQGLRIVVQELGVRQLASIDPGGGKLRGLAFAGDDFLLVTVSTTVDLGKERQGNHEFSQVQVVNLKTSKVYTVFGNQQGIRGLIVGYYGVAQKDGRWYGYFGQILQDDLDLMEVDLEKGSFQAKAHGDDWDQTWLIDGQGQLIALSEYEQASGKWRLLAQTGGGAHELMSRSTPLGDLTLLGQGRTPGTVLVEDSTGDDTLLEEISLKDGKSEALLGGESIRSMIFDPNTGLLLGAEVRGPKGAVLFDEGRQARARAALKTFPGFNTRLAVFDPALDHIIVATDGGDDSGTYWYIDIPKHSAASFAQQRPDVPAADVGPTRMYAYKASDGLALEGVLTLPPHRPAKGLPLIVMPHGGPLDERDDVGFDWWAQAFASRGYAVFQPNYRGSGGYGLAFLHSGYGEWGRKMLSDMSDGVAALAAEGVVDPKRACIVGASYGGYAALAGVTLQHGQYRCAVSVAGVSDLPALRRYDLDRNGGGDTAFSRYWTQALHGDAKDEPALAAISPIRLADKADAPVLLIHGRDDSLVPIDQSQKMFAALDGAGKSAQLIQLGDLDHWLSDETGRIKVLKASVEFAEKYNPPN
jgi:acetyl esterase/lipase